MTAAAIGAASAPARPAGRPAGPAPSDGAGQRDLEQRFERLICKSAPAALANVLGGTLPQRATAMAHARSSGSARWPEADAGEGPGATAPSLEQQPPAPSQAIASASHLATDARRAAPNRAEPDGVLAALVACAPQARPAAPTHPAEASPAPARNARDAEAIVARLAAALEAVLAPGPGPDRGAFLVELPARSAALAARVEQAASGGVAIALQLSGLEPGHKRRLARDLARHLGERGWRDCIVSLEDALQRG